MTTPTETTPAEIQMEIGQIIDKLNPMIKAAREKSIDNQYKYNNDTDWYTARILQDIKNRLLGVRETIQKTRHSESNRVSNWHPDCITFVDKR